MKIVKRSNVPSLCILLCLAVVNSVLVSRRWEAPARFRADRARTFGGSMQLIPLGLPRITRAEPCRRPCVVGMPRYHWDGDPNAPEEVQIDLPDGERPLRYLFFLHSRHGACLRYVQLPIGGWHDVENSEELDPEKMRMGEHRLFRMRVSVPLLAEFAREEGGDVLLVGITVQVEPLYAHFAGTTLYSLLLISPKRGSRGARTLRIHECPPLLVHPSHRRH